MNTSPSQTLGAHIEEKIAELREILTDLTAEDITWVRIGGSGEIPQAEHAAAEGGESTWSSAWDQAWDSVWDALIDEGRDEGLAGIATDLLREVEGIVWSRNGEDAWECISPMISGAVLGILGTDVAPEAATTLRREWERGLALRTWAQSAAPAQVEIARALADTWTGSGAELRDAAAESCALT